MGFIKTDDLQWCEKLNTCCFNLIEVRNIPSGSLVVVGNVDLYDYTDQEILNYIEGFGYHSQDDVKSQYGNIWTQIVAECIFESLSNEELDCFGPFKNEDEAEKEALSYINKQEQLDTYTIYQISDEAAEKRNIMFMSLDYLKRKGITINPDNYTKVYTGMLLKETKLDDLYEQFNINHPANYRGRSMSISDVVVIRRKNIKKAYYVDSFGFTLVPEFLNKI